MGASNRGQLRVFVAGEMYLLRPSLIMDRGRKEPIEWDRQSNCLQLHLGQIRSQMFLLLSGGQGQSDHLLSCRICEHLMHLLQDHLPLSSQQSLLLRSRHFLWSIEEQWQWMGR